MELNALIWQQKKDVSNLYLAYHDGGSRAWKLTPWNGQELLTYRVWYILNDEQQKPQPILKG